MFRNTAPVVEPAHDVVVAELIPLSHLELDLAAPEVGGWPAYLAAKGVAVLTDDLGRLAISRGDARSLFTEHREAEARKREAATEQERKFVEADQQWRSQLSPGVPWYAIPAGVAPAAAMLQAGRDAQPRRVTPLQEALGGDTLTYHPLPASSADES